MTLRIADLRSHLATGLAQRAAWRRLLAEAYPDDDRNGIAFETLSKWSAELAKMDDADPALVPLVAAAQKTGKDTPAAACNALGIDHTAASRVGFSQGAASLAALLNEWARQAAQSLPLEGA